MSNLPQIAVWQALSRQYIHLVSRLIRWAKKYPQPGGWGYPTWESGLVVVCCPYEAATIEIRVSFPEHSHQVIDHQIELLLFRVGVANLDRPAVVREDLGNCLKVFPCH